MKYLFIILTVWLSLIFSLELAGQPKTPQKQPSTKPLPTQPKQIVKLPTYDGKKLHYETINRCDSLALGLMHGDKTAPMYCWNAYPPVYSGDCLKFNTFCTYNLYAIHSTHPPFDSIPRDNQNVPAYVKGEKISISFILMAHDSLDLVNVLNNSKIQALQKSGSALSWINKGSLNSAQYKISNERSYSYGCPPTGYDKNMSDFKKFEALTQIIRSGSSMLPGNLPTPSPGFSSNLNPNSIMSPEGPNGMMPDPTSPQPKGDFPRINLKDERVLKEMSEHALNKAKQSLKAWMDEKNSCPNKKLNYWWVDVFYEHTLDVNETQLRLLINTTQSGPKDIILTPKFNVYLAVAYRHEMPTGDGERKFSMYVRSSKAISTGNLEVALVYNEGTLASSPSPLHKTLLSLGTAKSNNTFNLNISNANGSFPFSKTYYDDSNSWGNGKDIDELKSKQGDVNPIDIKGNNKVAYRIEIKSTVGSVNGFPFSSETINFTMPHKLTLALMGDSYSSGEGAPKLSGTPMIPWMNDHCHRSKNSGLYRGVQKFIKESDRACDFVFRACGGARVEDMISQPQKSNNPLDDNLLTEEDESLMQTKSQVNLVKDWMVNNNYTHVSCALFSIGGNNSGFGKIISAALFGSIGDAERKEVDDGIAFLNSTGYSNVNKALRNKLKVSNVFIMGAPDIVHYGDDNVCNSDCPYPNDPTNTFDQSELAFGGSLLARLNTAALTASEKFENWHYVDIFSVTKNHGICVCSNSYYTTFKEANSIFLAEGLVIGTQTYSVVEIQKLREACKMGRDQIPGCEGCRCSFHPSERGYRQYINPIYNKLREVYPN